MGPDTPQGASYIRTKNRLRDPAVEYATNNELLVASELATLGAQEVKMHPHSDWRFLVSVVRLRRTGSRA